MIHPRNSIQHLADRVLSPTTSPGLPFTGPLHVLMDHLWTGMDGASPHPQHLLCHFILSTLLICHSHWPFVILPVMLCALHTHVFAYGHTSDSLTPARISSWCATPTRSQGTSSLLHRFVSSFAVLHCKPPHNRVALLNRVMLYAVSLCPPLAFLLSYEGD